MCVCVCVCVCVFVLYSEIEDWVVMWGSLKCQGSLKVIALNTISTEYVILYCVYEWYMGICSVYGVTQTQTAFLNSNSKLKFMD